MLFFLGTKVLQNLCDEKTMLGRCEGLIAMPAEWHKKKVRLFQTHNPM